MKDIFQLNSPALMDVLPGAFAQRITQEASLIKYLGGQLIHSRGDSDLGFSIIHKGSANIGIYGLDGSFVMTGLLGPRQNFGESNYIHRYTSTP